MRRIFFSFLLMLLFKNPVFAEGKLQDRLAEIFPRNAHWAVVALDLKTGQEIISTGSALEKPLIPGSLVKLITAGAVLECNRLDLRTTILHDGKIEDGILYGSLYFRGQGNAFLSTADINAVAHTIAAKGIKRIIGNIIADDSLLDPKGLERSHSGSGYAPAGALGVDLHTAAVIVSPAEPDKPPAITVEPPNTAVRLAVEARTTTAQTGNIRVMQIDDLAYRVTGSISTGSGPLKWRFALHEPAFYASGALGAALNQAGVKVENKNNGRGKTPKGAKTLAEIEGPDLRALLRDVNVNSLNVEADNLFLLLGADKYGAPGTREKGVRAVNEFLATFGLHKGEAAIGDGSGLSIENRLTAGFLTRYLYAVKKRPWFESFRSSLPRAGIEGTVRDMGYQDEGFRVKSGRLEDVYALAGYGVDARGREIAFAFMVNTPGAAVLNMDRSGDEVMKYLHTEVIQ